VTNCLAEARLAVDSGALRGDHRPTAPEPGGRERSDRRGDQRSCMLPC
jgi:hypothetical protein